MVDIQPWKFLKGDQNIRKCSVFWKVIFTTSWECFSIESECYVFVEGAILFHCWTETNKKYGSSEGYGTFGITSSRSGAIIYPYLGGHPNPNPTTHQTLTMGRVSIVHAHKLWFLPQIDIIFVIFQKLNLKMKMMSDSSSAWSDCQCISTICVGWTMFIIVGICL